MEDLQLLDAVERYLRGEMTTAEREQFEQLRKSNPEVDQLVVEHMMFLEQMKQFGEWKGLKSALHEVHQQLSEEGVIRPETKPGLVTELWRRYKRVMAVAASIAGITTLLIAGMTSYFSRKASNADLEQLRREFRREVAQKTNEVRREVNDKISKTPANAQIISGGTGFLLDNKGYLATNAHVVANSNTIIVQNSKGHEFRARIAFLNPTSDLAILKIEDTDYTAPAPLPYGIRKSGADLGEPLFTLGYPRDEIVYNEGYMSAKTGYEGDTLTFQLGVSANPGNSGGPVFNKNGEVIGIINTRQVKAEGVVFALTAKNIYRTIEAMRQDSTLKEEVVKLPVSSSLRGTDRVQQIKKIEDYVFMVKSY